MSHQRIDVSGSGGAGDGADGQEATRLKSLSIPQRFEWTGLAESSTAADTGSAAVNGRKRKSAGEGDDESGDGFIFLEVLTDLPLWNILGYSVDDRSYLNLSLVCKEWQGFVSRMTPPVMLRMSALMERRNSTRGRRVIGTQEASELLRTAFGSFKTSSSPLYRLLPAVSKEGGGVSEDNAWPYLQPHFSLIIMTFVHDVCTQRSPNNGSARLYETTKGFVESHAQSVVDQVWHIMEASDQRRNDASELVNDLLHAWTSWEGVVRTISDVTEYLDRYYVVHHSLKSIGQLCRSSLIDAFLGRLDEEKEGRGGGEEVVRTDLPPPVSTLQRVILHVSSLLKDKNCSQGERVDLLRLSRVCVDLFSNLDNPNDTTRHVRDAYRAHIAPHIPGAEESTAQDHVGLSETGAASNDASTDRNTSDQVLIVAMPDNVPFVLSPRSHLLSASGLLRKLHLLGGETIRFNVSSSVLEKAVEFNRLQEEEPLPEVPRPIVSTDMVEVVGQRYAAFADLLDDQAVLFGLLQFANLMDLKPLLDLTAFKVAVMIRGRTPQQIRETFNIPNDFSPEEEAQMREEDQWIEDA